MIDGQDTIKAVFFDAAGTLLKLRGTVGDIYSRIARHYGAELDPGRLNQSFQSAFMTLSKDFSRYCETASQDSGRQWWFELVRQVTADSIAPEQLGHYFDELYSYFRTAEAWSLYPEVKKTLEHLRASGLRLGIISNFDSRLRDILTALEIGSLFDHQALSWEVGAAKPDPKIFSRALQAMRIPPSEAIHVGDSVKEDVEGARNAGLKPVLLDRRGTHPGWTACPVIRNIEDLRLTIDD